jgi:hypothetical protein
LRRLLSVYVVKSVLQLFDGDLVEMIHYKP